MKCSSVSNKYKNINPSCNICGITWEYVQGLGRPPSHTHSHNVKARVKNVKIPFLVRVDSEGGHPGPPAVFQDWCDFAAFFEFCEKEFVLSICMMVERFKLRVLCFLASYKY